MIVAATGNSVEAERDRSLHGDIALQGLAGDVEADSGPRDPQVGSGGQVDGHRSGAYREGVTNRHGARVDGDLDPASHGEPGRRGDRDGCGETPGDAGTGDDEHPDSA